jgi:predicted Zn-dependent protease
MAATLSLLFRATALACVLAVAPTLAAAQSIIRDAEIERALRELAAPVFREAGLSQSTRVIIINDGSMNAFVADARHVFLHSGLLLRLDNPDQVQAVLAHEAAHIANGHLTARPAAAASAQSAARMGLLLALAAGAASGDGGAAVGIAAGSASAAQRSLLAHTRAEEASADQSALRYMVSAGIDPTAMLEVLDLFRGQEALSVGRQDPYVRSHPLTRDRYRTVQAFLATRGAGPEPSVASCLLVSRASTPSCRPSCATRPGRSAGSTGVTPARSPPCAAPSLITGPRTPTARWQRSGGCCRCARTDPFYQELQGQILYESRRYDAAITAYARAVELAPREALILAGYGRALLAPDTSRQQRPRPGGPDPGAGARSVRPAHVARPGPRLCARRADRHGRRRHRRTLRDPAPDGRCRGAGQSRDRPAAPRLTQAGFAHRMCYAWPQAAQRRR